MKNLEQITEVPIRYLWAANLDEQMFPQGSLIADRYAVQHSQVVVDTQAYNLPEIPDDFPDTVIGYLRLARLNLHLPRPYGLLTPESIPALPAGTAILLLDNVPLDANGNLLPQLTEVWAEQPPLRQINWLWQILHLWRPLEDQGFNQSLLNWDYMRVDGAWVRLLQLEPNQAEVPLTKLGDQWLQWLDGVHRKIHDSIAELVYGIARGSQDVDSAIAFLDRVAAEITKNRSLTVRIATATDPGRRRDYNEDNCFPAPTEETLLVDSLQNCVAIVCDGLGGHEGGEVASRMAIDSLCTQLEPLLHKIETGELVYNPTEFMHQLETIVKTANDSIVTMNDQQQRTAQRRMGTTLVMAVIPRPLGQPTHEVFLVHVGDSRIYWISADSCRQVTLDDDVATRETILGLNFYAYATQRVDGGALIQALGTRSSDVLLPRVQRLILDEECLLLLCSDGLSDFERVPEIYSTHIRPILTDHLSLTASCQNLIHQGNFLNGHDNITVALMRCQTAPYEEVDVPIQPKLARSRKFASSPKTTEIIPPQTNSQTTNTSIPTQVVPKRRQKKQNNFWLVCSIVLMLLAGAGAWIVFNLPLIQKFLNLGNASPTDTYTPTIEASPQPLCGSGWFLPPCPAQNPSIQAPPASQPNKQQPPFGKTPSR
jgi:protein phosphatase